MTTELRGYSELLVALKQLPRETEKRLRDEFRQAGRIVRDDAEQRFEEYSPKTAAGFGVVVRMRGVEVEQRLRKTTGKRPDWGRTQMRLGLLPAVEDNEDEIERAAAAAAADAARALGF